MKKLISVLAIVALSATLFAVNTQAVSPKPKIQKISQETTTEIVTLDEEMLKSAFRLNQTTSLIITEVNYDKENALNSTVTISTSDVKTREIKPGIFSSGGTFTARPKLGKHTKTLSQICMDQANEHNVSNMIVVPKGFKRIEIKNGTRTDNSLFVNFSGDSLNIVIKCIKTGPKKSENKGFVGSKKPKTQIATRKATKTAPRIA
jgi:hypothetical protein